MTQMGTNLLDDIWPVFDAEGALSTARFTRQIAANVTSANLISGALGTTTYSTGFKALLGSYKAFDIDGQRIQQNDRLLRCPKSVLSVTPDVDDHVIIGATIYRIMEASESVDGASWKLQIRNP